MVTTQAIHISGSFTYGAAKWALGMREVERVCLCVDDYGGGWLNARRDGQRQKQQ